MALVSQDISWGHTLTTNLRSWRGSSCSRILQGYASLACTIFLVRPSLVCFEKSLQKNVYNSYLKILIGIVELALVSESDRYLPSKS